MHPKVVFSKIIGITLESAIWICATYGLTIKGFAVAPFFMQVVSVSINSQNLNCTYLYLFVVAEIDY